MKKILSLAFTLFLSLQLFAQLGDVKIETKDGKRVYAHVVEKGNTLWALHRLYDVPVEQIILANPGVENGLKEGQTVYIPVPVTTSEKVHIVAAGETMSSIARKYGVNVNELIGWNPGTENSIQIGQSIKILSATYATVEATPVEVNKQPAPAITVTFNDSIVEHVVLQGETMSSISRRYIVPVDKLIAFNNKKNANVKPGEVIRIPLRKERISTVDVRPVPSKDKNDKPTVVNHFQKKETYNVAIMLPFGLNGGAAKGSANMAAEFLMGAQLALDSLKRLGLNAKVFVYDTENSQEKIASILDKPEFKSMDLIIGPLHKAQAPAIADWCLKNQVRFVVPVNVDTKILQNNPYVYTTMASDITLMKGMAKYIAKNFTDGKVVLVKPTTAQDSVLYQAFRTEYMRLVGVGGSKLIEVGPTSFTTYLSTSGKTALVYPTTSSKAAISFVNELGRFVHKIGKSTYVFGTDSWLDFDGLTMNNRTKFRVSIPTSIDLNYAYDRVKNVHRKYRGTYRSDFSKIAVQGFDVTYNFCAELLLGKSIGQMLMNDFECIQVGTNHGYENHRTEILSYDNYELINITNGLE